MKKLITILAGLLLLTACVKVDTEYVVTYRIHYPDTVIQEQRHIMGPEEFRFRVWSSDGTDYLEGNNGLCSRIIRSSSAPIEFISAEKVKD